MTNVDDDDDDDDNFDNGNEDDFENNDDNDGNNNNVGGSNFDHDHKDQILYGLKFTDMVIIFMHDFDFYATNSEIRFK